MNRIPVVSSSVASIGYDQATKTLEVEFKRGNVYQYFDVPASLHAGLLDATSVGSYLDSNVKKAGYAYGRVRD